VALTRWRRIIGGIVLVTAVSACGSLESAGEDTRTAPLTLHAAHAALPANGKKYIGVYEPGSQKSYKLIDEFATAIGRQPSLVLDYSSWYTPFPLKFATTALSHGAAPLIQIQPGGISLKRIAGGSYDGYLRAYAGQVRAFGHPVILSFGHEMNGTWYDWGAGHVPP
jgi:hypothetical protein